MKLLSKLSFVLLLALVGCGSVNRTLSIDSSPQGALVYLADEEIGRTPLDVDFSWYGDYEVTLRHPDSQVLKTHRRIKAPFWEYPPVDLLCKLLPISMSNEVKWEFTLEPARPVQDKELIYRAKELAQSLDE